MRHLTGRAALVAAGLLLLAVLGGASALALTSGSTVSVCATATAPGHVVAVDGTPVTTTPAAVQQQCATTTVPTVTVTQTVTVPATTPVTTTVPATTTAPTTTAPAPSVSPFHGGGWGLIQTGTSLGRLPLAEQQQGKVVIVDCCDGDAQKAAALPGTSLAYMDATIVRHDGGSGVDWNAANQQGFLTGVESSSYPATYANIGSAAYQQWVGQQAVQVAKRTGVDGVFLDDVSEFYAPGSPIPQAQRGPDILGVVKAVGAALHANGLYLVTNTNGYQSGNNLSNDGTLQEDWWEQVAPYVDAVFYEYWAEASDGTNLLRLSGPAWNQLWDQWQAQLVKFHKAFPGTGFLGNAYGDNAHLTYARASLELADPDAVFIGSTGTGADPAGGWQSCAGPPTVNPAAGTAAC